MGDCGCEMEARNAQERQTLRIVLGINALMFVVEFGLGIFAESTGLIADSLDMLADASVYILGLLAVGNTDSFKRRSAQYSGVLQILLALFVLLDVGRRFILGSEPMSLLMVLVGMVALGANTICLMLIAKHRKAGVHMRASFIFSQNDVIANLGVILSGFFVSIFNNRHPDLIMGLLITILVLWGGIKILREARD